MELDVKLIQEMNRRRFSPRTIETYISSIHKFLSFCKKDIRYASKKDALDFLYYLDKERAVSGSTLNVNLMAIRFLFEEVLHKNVHLDIKYSKIPKRLPIVLSKEEIKRLFNAIKNEKHRLMIEFMYSAGLRVSELINMKIKDMNFDNNYGFVRGGKGNKDRIFIIAENLKKRIRELIRKESLEKEDGLFLTNKRKKYSSATITEIIKKAIELAGIDKKVHPHTLRHSFATHLIEDGVSVSEVQALLGHKSPETTFIYLHTSSPQMIKVKSPLDFL